MKKFNITWTPGNDGGSAITGHDVGYTPSGGSETVVATGSTDAAYTLGGLTDDVEYSVRVRAENSAGKGAWSSAFVQVAAIGVASGPLYAWGSNSNGQFGTGFVGGSTYSSPNLVGSDQWLYVDAGQVHSVGIKEDGTLYGWGKNSTGAVGDGSTTDRTSPVQVGTGAWIAVAAGLRTSHAIKSDNTLWGWGENGPNAGLVGNGQTNTVITAPVQIGASETWKYVSSHADDYETAHAITTSGQLYGWGFNQDGSVGDGTTTKRNSPTQVGSDTDWKMASSGSTHSAGLREDGSLYAWGSNWAGQLGNGSTTNTLSPVKIGTDSWAMVSVGQLHTVGIKADGTLWAWGYGEQGQIGNGSTNATNSSPVQIGSDTWVWANADYRSSFGIKSDGTLWSWGENNVGQLGLGDTTRRTSPVQVGSGTWQRIYGGARHTFGIASAS